MALSGASLKEALRAAFDGNMPEGEDEANRVFGNTVLKYLCDNIEITYMWAGFTTSTPPVADPQNGLIEAGLTGGGTLGAAGDGFGPWLLSLRNLIMGLTIVPPPGFTLPLVFNPAGALNVVMMPAHDNYGDAMTAFCNQLVTSILSTFVSPLPVSGSNAAFQGAASGMVIR